MAGLQKRCEERTVIGPLVNPKFGHFLYLLYLSLHLLHSLPIFLVASIAAAAGFNTYILLWFILQHSVSDVIASTYRVVGKLEIIYTRVSVAYFCYILNFNFWTEPTLQAERCVL